VLPVSARTRAAAPKTPLATAGARERARTVVSGLRGRVAPAGPVASPERRAAMAAQAGSAPTGPAAVMTGPRPGATTTPRAARTAINRAGRLARAASARTPAGPATRAAVRPPRAQAVMTAREIVPVVAPGAMTDAAASGPEARVARRATTGLQAPATDSTGNRALVTVRGVTSGLPVRVEAPVALRARAEPAVAGRTTGPGALAGELTVAPVRAVPGVTTVPRDATSGARAAVRGVTTAPEAAAPAVAMTVVPIPRVETIAAVPVRAARVAKTVIRVRRGVMAAVRGGTTVVPAAMTVTGVLPAVTIAVRARVTDAHGATTGGLVAEMIVTPVVRDAMIVVRAQVVPGVTTALRAVPARDRAARMIVRPGLLGVRQVPADATGAGSGLEIVEGVAPPLVTTAGRARLAGTVAPNAVIGRLAGGSNARVVLEPVVAGSTAGRGRAPVMVVRAGSSGRTVPVLRAAPGAGAVLAVTIGSAGRQVVRAGLVEAAAMTGPEPIGAVTGRTVRAGTVSRSRSGHVTTIRRSARTSPVTSWTRRPGPSCARFPRIWPSGWRGIW